MKATYYGGFTENREAPDVLTNLSRFPFFADKMKGST